MIKVDGKLVDILKLDWKVFVILDASRYEVFEELYKDVLKKKGVLKKAKSLSCCTKEWMGGNFNGKDCSDIIYINPIIMFKNFIPDNRFFKIVNVWEKKWNYFYGTIMPDDMTKSALEQIKEHPDKRFIIHYHQPHPPFLNPEIRKIRKTIVTPESVLRRIDKIEKDKTQSLPYLIQGNMRRFLGAERAWTLMLKMGIEPLDGMGQTFKHFGMKGIKDAYKENMRIGLEGLNSLLSNVDDKIIISSDHSFNYDRSRDGLKRRYVPWLEVN